MFVNRDKWTNAFVNVGLRANVCYPRRMNKRVREQMGSGEHSQNSETEENRENLTLKIKPI